MKFRYILAAIIISVFLPVLTACLASSDKGHISRTALYFDTAVTIDVYGADDEALSAVAEECMNLCAHYEKLFNKNDPESDIALINQATGTVKVDHDTALLISDSLRYCELSGGLFDITVKPLTDLWDFHEANAAIPDKDEVADKCRLIDYRNVSVDTTNNTVTLKDSAIDPGGSAKGYIANRIAHYIMSTDATGAIINIGGDIQTVGTKSDGKPFTIGIRDPFNKNDVLLPLELSDRAVATSGVYERCFYVGNKRYHHILDTATGYPADTDIESVTVITADALSADCLCTICILYGSTKAMNFIEEVNDTEAIFVLSDGSVMMTAGADKYIRQ